MSALLELESVSAPRTSITILRRGVIFECFALVEIAFPFLEENDPKSTCLLSESCLQTFHNLTLQAQLSERTKSISYPWSTTENVKHTRLRPAWATE